MLSRSRRKHSSRSFRWKGDVKRLQGFVRLSGLAILFGVASLCVLPSVHAQDVVELLQEQRRQAVLDRAADQFPPPEPRDIHLYPQTDPVLVALDARDARRRFVADSTAQAREDSVARALAKADTLFAWRKVSPSNQAGFIADYREVFWRALGGFGFSPIDTMRTLELRSRMTQRGGKSQWQGPRVWSKT